MSSTAAHMLAFGRLLALLLLVANSGFTVALSYCTMCDTEQDVMECCDVPRPCPSGACSTAELPDPTGTTLTAGGSAPCLVTMVAGGAPAAPTISERAAAHRELPSVTPLPRLPLDESAGTVREHQLLVFPRDAASSAPPRLEKYVLYHSFRI